MVKPTESVPQSHPNPTPTHTINYGPSVNKVESPETAYVGTNQYIFNIKYEQNKYSSFSKIELDAIRTRSADFELADSLQVPFRLEVIGSLRTAVLRHKLLVIQVRPETPGRWLLEETALEVNSFLSSQTANANAPLTIRVYDSLKETDDNHISFLNAVETELQVQTEPTILLIPEASRQHIGWDLAGVSRLAKRHGHYVLAMTSVAPEIWHRQPHEEGYWYEIQNDEPLFSPIFLTAFLRQRLIERQNKLPRIMQQKTQSHALLLGDGWTVSNVAERLKSPVNIDAWLQMVSKQDKGIESTDLHSLVHEFASQNLRHIITHWYHDALNPQERLLTLGLCLMDGLDESQILTAFKVLKQSVWKQLGAVGEIIDHIDLLQLRTFFNFHKLNSTEVRIESAISGQRQILLQLALENQPMHLREIIPWFTQIIKESNEQDASFSLLYATKHHRDQIRLAASTNLSDLYTLAPKIVQPVLIELIADRRDAVHVYLARTLARLILLDPRSSIPALLGYWRENLDIHKRIRELLRTQHNMNLTNEAATLVNGVIILTVSYVWRYAKPEEQISEISQLLILAIEDLNPRVRRYLQKYLLPLLPRYCSQLDPALRLLVRDSEFQQQIINALFKLYSHDPSKVDALMNRWFQDAKSDMKWYSPSANPSPAEALLVTVSQTLCIIALTQNVPSIFNTIHQRLYAILHEVRHPTMRSTAWDNCLAISNNDILSLTGLLTTVQEDDVSMLKEKLTTLFQHQYANLPVEQNKWRQNAQHEESPDTLLVNGTVIELAVLALIYDGNTLSQKFAYKCLFNFAQHVQHRWKADGRVPSQIRPAPLTGHYHTFYSDILVQVLITQDQDQNVREAVLNLLSQTRKYYERYPDTLWLMLGRLKRTPDMFSQRVAICLQEAIRLDTSKDWGKVVGLPRLRHAFMMTWQTQIMPRDIQIRVVLLFLSTIMAIIIATTTIITNANIISLLILALTLIFSTRWLYRCFTQLTILRNSSLD